MLRRICVMFSDNSRLTKQQEDRPLRHSEDSIMCRGSRHLESRLMPILDFR